MTRLCLHDLFVVLPQEKDLLRLVCRAELSRQRRLCRQLLPEPIEKCPYGASSLAAARALHALQQFLINEGTCCCCI